MHATGAGGSRRSMKGKPLVGFLVTYGPPQKHASYLAGVHSSRKGVGPGWEKGIESGMYADHQAPPMPAFEP